MNFLQLSCALLASASLSTAAMADDARVRVVHASPDAPAVDVLVDGGVAFAGIAFRDITGYASLPAGTYQVQVTPAMMNDIVVIDADLSLDADTDYTVVAIGELADIAPLVLVDDNTLDPDNARIRFVHASPDAPAVDIALADGGPVLFGNVSFGGFGDYLSVPGGTYDLEVRLAGTDTVVLPLPGVAVESNAVYTVYATGFAGGGEPALSALVGVDNQAARIRVVHASPDAPAVDVLVNGSAAITDLAFTESTDYVGLAPDTYAIAVTPAGQPDIKVIEAQLSLAAATDSTVVAVGELANIAPLVLADDNTLVEDQARVRFVHASPDAPAVDIALAGGAVLFGGVAFTEVGDYLAVPPGGYDLEVRVAGTDTVVLPLPGIQLRTNTVYTVFAMGFAFDTPALQAVITVDASGPSPAGPADLNGDLVVDGTDLGLLLEDWGRMDSAADLDGSGMVGGSDLGLLLASWTL